MDNRGIGPGGVARRGVTVRGVGVAPTTSRGWRSRHAKWARPMSEQRRAVFGGPASPNPLARN